MHDMHVTHTVEPIDHPKEYTTHFIEKLNCITDNRSVMKSPCYMHWEIVPAQYRVVKKKSVPTLGSHFHLHVDDLFPLLLHIMKAMAVD